METDPLQIILTQFFLVGCGNATPEKIVVKK